MKYILALFALIVATIAAQAQLSVEALAAVRNLDLSREADFGAGVDLGYKLNQYVTGHVRAIGYSNNDWRGGVVDEASALAEASLLQSPNKKLSLAAIGGADRDFEANDWGFSVGFRPSIALSPKLSLVGESRIRAWFKQSKDLITTIGLNWSF